MPGISWVSFCRKCKPSPVLACRSQYSPSTSVQPLRLAGYSPYKIAVWLHCHSFQVVQEKTSFRHEYWFWFWSRVLNRNHRKARLHSIPEPSLPASPSPVDATCCSEGCGAKNSCQKQPTYTHHWPWDFFHPHVTIACSVSQQVSSGWQSKHRDRSAAKLLYVKL